MNDGEFIELMGLMDDLGECLNGEKVFIKNPVRYAEVQTATKIAKKLFKECTVSVEDDPLRTGGLILCICGFDISAENQGEIKLFQQLISQADNFEIFSVGDEKVKFAIMFNGVLTRLP